jgi:GntR family transcriptional regulator
MSIKSDNRHLYLQVIDKIKEDIENGTYKEKEKLPSEFELSKSLGVSRATLREALRILEEENVIIRRHGVGTFVNSKPRFTSGIEQLNSVTGMIEKANLTPGTIFLSSSIISATDDVVKRFKCEQDEEIFLLERVRTANGEPVVYCLDKIPTTILPESFGHVQESLFEMLEEKANIY